MKMFTPAGPAQRGDGGLETVLFILGKVVGAAVRPDTWLIATLVVVVLALWRGRLALARRLGTALLVALLALAVLPLGDLALRPLEGRYPPAPPIAGQVDGIVVLGGAESVALTRLWGPVQLNDAAERMTETLTLARMYPQARVVFTGGSGALRNAFETQPARGRPVIRLFTDLGLERERLTLETASRNTAENARLTRRLIEPGDTETWVLVTSAFHMPRAVASFHAEGWTGTLVPWPVDYRGGPLRLDWNLSGQMIKLQIALREYAGILGYRLSGQG
jgi:uncharacterized SAM-binding protein YcdF (DUF218 family)